MPLLSEAWAVFITKSNEGKTNIYLDYYKKRKNDRISPALNAIDNFRGKL